MKLPSPADFLPAMQLQHGPLAALPDRQTGSRLQSLHVIQSEPFLWKRRICSSDSCSVRCNGDLGELVHKVFDVKTGAWVLFCSGEHFFLSLLQNLILKILLVNCFTERLQFLNRNSRHGCFFLLENFGV